MAFEQPNRNARGISDDNQATQFHQTTYLCALALGLLPIHWVVDTQYDVDLETPLEEDLVQTEIAALQLAGYTDAVVHAAGIGNEETLRPYKLPVYPEAYFDTYSEKASDVGDAASVDTVNNIITIENPKGLSVFGIEGRSTIPAVTEWGLIVMTLLVLSAGTVVLLRRRDVTEPCVSSK